MSEPQHAVSRRALLLGLSAVPAAAYAVPAAAAGTAEPLRIRRRAEWAVDLRPRGALSVEAAGDVRFLLVHHTASTNAYRPIDVVGLLRGVYGYHTGTKGWPDIAYNFLVDRYGTVWEGRAGSLTEPVMASATGGSQGFAQLACFLGDCSRQPPTTAARTAMIGLLARLADRYGIDTEPGATSTFRSRGSNRWPAGSRVRTATIAGHRDMSLTSCPGDGVYSDVRSRFAADVSALRAAVSSSPAVRRTPSSTRGSTRSTAGETVSPAISSSQHSAGPPTRAAAASDGAREKAASDVDLQPIGIAGAVAVACVAAVIAVRSRRD